MRLHCTKEGKCRSLEEFKLLLDHEDVDCGKETIKDIFCYYRGYDSSLREKLLIKEGVTYDLTFEEGKRTCIINNEHYPLFETKGFELVIVRHGISRANELDRLCGWTNTPLAEIGYQQLRENREKYEYPLTQMYFSSDLDRAIETFQTLYPDQKLDGTDWRLRETNVGIHEDSPQPKGMEAIMGRYRRWLLGEDVGFKEKYTDIAERMMDAASEYIDLCIAKGYHSLTLVGHDGLIRTLVNEFHHGPSTGYLDVRSDNGGGIVMTIDNTENGPLVRDEYYIQDRKKNDKI